MLVLSGLLGEQEAEVLAAYRTRRLRLKRRIALENWRTLVLGR
jgi:ribosomal protein L11 methylase PrmA